MNDTKAVIGMPLLSAVPSGVDSTNTAYGIVVAVGLGLFAVYTAAKRFSRDKVGYTEDRAKEDLIQMLQTQNEKLIAERDKAMKTAEEAWDHRTADAAMIGELKAGNKHLHDRVEQLLKEVEQLSQIVHKLRNELAGKKPAEIIVSQ